MISSSSSSSSSSKEIALSTTSSSSLSGSSPYHRLGPKDDVFISIEEGCEDATYSPKKGEVELLRIESDDAFSIPSKNASIEKLRRWRQATLALNAARRFRYTLDLKEEKKKEEMRRKIRAHAQVIRAAILFKEAGGRKPDGGLPITPHGGYGVGREQLSSMTRDRNFSALQDYGGLKGLATLLKTNLEMGIGGDDAELVHRRNIFGANTYPRKKGRNFLAFVVDAFKDLTLMILIVAALASLALGIKTEGIKKGWYDGGSIAFAVILVVVVTAISDYKQSLQFQSLNEEKHNIRVEVKRSNRPNETSIFDVVVGDVVCLKIGDQVPADGVLISGHSLSIDESSMTGESKIVHKNPNAPFLMSGCKVADGVGSMLVTGVGLNTEWGLLMASISEDNNEETPLQVRLNGVATFIGKVGLTVAGFVLLVLLVRYFTGHTRRSDGTVQYKAGQTSGGTIADDVVKMITIAVTIVVVAIPEGLPLAVTLTLAYSMRKMMADKALVRRLSACETMGSATTICSDKTGTLTLNQMTVVRANVSGEDLYPLHDPRDNIQLLIEGIAQNTTGSVFIHDGGTEEVRGSPTEKAILSWGLQLGMKFAEERSKTKILHVFPFNSEKKRGGVAILGGDSAVRIHWKGAAEIVLALCTKWLDLHGVVQPMNDKKNEFMTVIGDMAEHSLRCIAFAYRSFDGYVPNDEEQLEQWKLPEDDLVLLAIAGLKDPCRPGVIDAVLKCKNANIKVRMVTGDNLQTAKAIALECGILDSESVLIEGSAFRRMSEEERTRCLDKLAVMGRSSPNDKLLLVQTLRKQGDVVAVTGDGTNDAPALHEVSLIFIIIIIDCSRLIESCSAKR